MNVLIADDNATSCKLLRAVLEAEGHKVIEAADGVQALHLLERQPVDAIIADLLMPNLDGYRLCREVRQNERWRTIPFICYTAIYGSLNDEKLAFDLGADAYLRKPVSNAILLRTLRGARQRVRAEPRRPKASHAELDVLTEYSQPLVAKLAKRHVELKEKSQLAGLAVEVGMALTRRNELGEILQACTDSVIRHLGAVLARIWMLNEKRQVLELRASAGTDPLGDEMPLGESIAEHIAQQRCPYQTKAVLDDASHVPQQEWVRREGVAALAGYPLIVEERLVGVMVVFTRRELPASASATLGAIAHFLALGIQRKRAEAVLRDSEERFRQLAENISGVFWMTDPAKTQILYVSPGYETIWGRTCESLRQQPRSYLDAIHPEDRPWIVNALRAGVEAPYELEYRVVRPDGIVRWVRDRGFPVRDEAGRVIRIAGIAEDVTQRRQLEMQLRHAQKMEAIGRLAGGVAHGFNNLLSVIYGHSELLAATSPSPERLRESLAEISRAAERGAALTQELLAFGRRQVVEPKVLDLNAVVAESRNLLQPLIGEDVQLAISLAPRLSAVKADPSQIGQVLMNLALNARDAMPQGGRLTIETRALNLDVASANNHPEARPGHYVLLTVSDTGWGMTPELQARIFEPFFSTKSDGTGLGLSVVDGIVKQNGGYLILESRPGLGTTFKIYLPAVTEPVEEPSRTPPSAPAQGGETVLLVEDENAVRAVTAQLLETLGYRVLQAGNAEEALLLARVSQQKIDLLMTDVVMPGISGRELAEALRVQDPSLKVLFQSGHTDDVMVRHGIL
ncbi:MAG: response regulator, partial [Verrucomicrobia bacterium]|nr:response regulator [Verrucomicrobiota bacterium]